MHLTICHLPSHHLSPACCQAFLYRGAVSQLERLVNHFLSLLSDSTLRFQLSLDGDRISKAVSYPHSSLSGLQST